MAKKDKIVKDDSLDLMADVLVDLGLTEKEQDFVLRYMQSYNATQSALKAYNVDKRRASVLGSQVLHKPRVQSALKKLKKIQRRVFEIDPNEYLEFLIKSARADISDYLKFSEEEVPVLDKDGSVMRDPDTGEPITKFVNKMHLVDSEDVDASLIVSVKQGRDGISINLPDKMQAWEKLRQYFGWGEKKEEKDDNSDSIIKAIQGKTDEVWDDDAVEGVDDELEEALKDG